MLTRREFILKTFEYGGFGALAMMGLEKEARSWGIMPLQAVGVSSAHAVAYADWNEATELVTDSAVWLLESPTATNEIGVDSRAVPITGADLILTVSAGLDAAIGSPPSRLFDGLGDYGTVTTNATNILANGTNTWSLIIKAENLTGVQTANKGVVQIRDATAANLIKVIHSGGTFWQVNDGGSARIGANTVAPIPTTGMVHIAFWGDATYVRCGWCGAAGGSGANGQPTLSSDFPGNNRRSYTGTVTWANGDFSGLKEFMRLAAEFLAGKLYYILMSDTCLITNDA